MRAFLVAATIIITLLSGCFSSSDDPVDQTGDGAQGTDIRLTLPEDPMSEESEEHSHLDATKHQFLWNYEFSSRDPLQGSAAFSSGLHALDMQNGFLFGAIYGSESASNNGGMQIWDLSDPAQPVARGAVNLPGTVGGDRSVGATSDGNFVVIGAETIDCFGHTNPIPVAAYLIDATDKDNPVVVDTLSASGNSANDPTGSSNYPTSVHSVYVKNIGGKDYAILSGAFFEIMREGGVSGPYLRDTGVSVDRPHDVYFRDTPWGSVWGLAAYGGGGGFQLFDASNVDDIRLIATWDLPDRSNLTEEYYFHTADVAFFDDGQIIIIVSSEDWGDHVSPFWILDGTELRNHSIDDEPLVPEWIGTWANPGGHHAGQYPAGASNPNPEDIGKGGISFSLHNPRFLENGILTMSHYHGGVWQFDFNHEEFRADPNVIGYAVFTEGEPPAAEDPAANAVESAACQLGIRIETPTYMDQEMDMETGVIYAADVYMGLYTFTPSATHPVYGTSS